MVDENGMLDLHLDTLERSCFVELVLPDKNFFLFCFVLFFFCFFLFLFLRMCLTKTLDCVIEY